MKVLFGILEILIGGKGGILCKENNTHHNKDHVLLTGD